MALSTPPPVAGGDGMRSADSGSAYRGRFAPSPTGPLHFGSLIAALASYSDALAANGQWLLRIEDVDRPRTRDGAESTILATLERYGFAWHGSVMRQSTRTARYASVLEHLIAHGYAYPCTCTRRELATAPPGIAGERVYPGTCRSGLSTRSASGAQRAWRMRVETDEAEGPIAFRDRVQGMQAQSPARDIGDFVVKRADGLFAYQLAVVVDDADQGISDIVRGADLCPSTPRQILLQRRLGYRTPAYLHVPVALDHAGHKLSKQTRAAPVPPSPLPTLVAAWRFLGQLLPEADWKPASVDAFWAWAARAWSPSRVPPVAALPATHVSEGQTDAAV